MSNLNPDDWFREPNDGAYETTKERTGPPLDYVAEKLRSSLKACHKLVAALKGAPGTAPQGQGVNLSFEALRAF
jgi:hypothetical protein